MEEKELKTSPKQRIFIIIIAVIMLGSMIAGYAGIVIGGSMGKQSDETPKVDEAKVAEYEEAYNAKLSEFKKETAKDYEKFIKYKNDRVKGYNENSANEGGVVKKDLKEGSGDKLTDSNYLAYYVGWCADETIFDSSFDDNDEPTSFAKILNPSLGMIEGWTKGVEGMKLGGIREITVPGELAYGDTMEICGGKNKPLKFLIMAVENKEPIKSLSNGLDEAYMRYQYAQYGMDYDSQKEAE